MFSVTVGLGHQANYIVITTALLVHYARCEFSEVGPYKPDFHETWHCTRSESQDVSNV